MYLFKTRYRQQEQLFETDGGSFLEKQHDILDYPVTIAHDVKTNIIQPPYQTNVKVKLIPNPSSSATKKSIKYTELGEEEIMYDDEHVKKLTDDLSSGEYSPNQTVNKSVNTYREKITNFISKYRLHSQDNNNQLINNEKRLWQPEPVASSDIVPSVPETNARLQRPDSVILNEESLGRIAFTMYYSSSEEYLTLLLISGRQINSCDQNYNIRLPAVSVVIENNPNSEVTSNPDEAPNPEYDQEFTFTIRSCDLFNVVLQFTIWDIIANNETRVVGFLRLQLSNYHKILMNGSDTGTICKEIQPFLCPVSSFLFLNQFGK